MGNSGSDRIRQELRRARALGQVHGAYLFTGPPGTPKRDVALWFARLLLCREEGDDPCGRCPDCLRLRPDEDGSGIPRQHPDLRVVEPDGNAIKVAQIRTLQRELGLVANEGGRRVALILDADRLLRPASNALLKTLEEPRPDTSLLLVADVAEILPRTVRSRTTLLRFPPEPEDSLVATLRGTGLGEDDARLVASMSAGGVESAERWADEHLDAAREMRAALRQAETGTPGMVLEFAEGFRGKAVEARGRVELLLDVHRALGRQEVEGAARSGDREALGRWLDRVEAGERARREMQRRNLNPQLVVEGLLLGLRRPDASAR